MFVDLKITRDLEALLGVYDKHKKTAGFNVFACTWDNVIEQMQQAQRQYEQKGKKAGVIRGFFRHGKSAKMLLSPLLEVIPEDYGLNALKGGLGLLFHVCPLACFNYIRRLSSSTSMSVY